MNREIERILQLKNGASMSTTEIIGKHDVLCSSLNFATPEGTAECDCNLSIMADMLEALEALVRKLASNRGIFEIPVEEKQALAAIAKARGGAA